MVQKERIRNLNAKNTATGSVIAYWMSRDQRVGENWALLFAQELAERNNIPLIVFFVLTPDFPGAPLRQYDFMIRGLQEVEKSLQEVNIPFVLQVGDPAKELPNLIQRYDVKVLVTDFSPIRIGRSWRDSIGNEITIPFYEVDTHNIVPVWESSAKQEYAAYTIRPKINKKLDQFLIPFPKTKNNKKHAITRAEIDWEAVYNLLPISKEVQPVSWIIPGEKEAKKRLSDFISTEIRGYSTNRNNPNLDAQSNLSPYLHFGQISAQYIALSVKDADIPTPDKDAFLEELIIRRELTENYCYYNLQYDSSEGFPAWAKQTLKEHRIDKREYLYTRDELEEGKTHDAIWNKAQMEMVRRGKMHGYLRMYWAKKILEWSASAKEAMETAVYLNDTYELDGRDPNGYVGCAWSIGGVHDRPWFERPIFGKIRYMNANGLKRKFDVEKYLSTEVTSSDLK